MSTNRLCRGPIQFRVTVGADDAPALFAALSTAKAGRARVLRFRELAVKGLLIEQLGLKAIDAIGAAAAASMADAQPAKDGGATWISVDETVDWFEEGAGETDPTAPEK